MPPSKPSSRVLEPDARALRGLIDACAEFVAQHIDSLSRQPSWDTEGAAEVAAGFREAAPEQGSDLAVVLKRLGPAIAKSFNTAGPGYLAYIPGGGLPSAALADFIACAVNRFVGVAAAAPVLARIEATAIEWLATAMGYPSSAGGILTSGGSISNLTALITARIAKLPEDFLRGTIYLSEQTHHSVERAARLAGFPGRAVRMVPVDARLRLRASDLEAMIRADSQGGRQPFLVIANVGTTNTGAVDPLPDILQVARRHDLWVHADAAYGGFFRLAPGGDRLMPGIEDCDSITIDPHKGLFLPYGTGCLLMREPGLLKAAHRGGGDYFQDLHEAEVAPDFHSLSPELSRDFRGLRVWLPIVLHGLAVFREQIQEKLDLARGAWESLRAAPFLEMIDEPQLSIVAFAGRPRRGDPNVFAAELLRRVNARRRVFLSSTTLGGRFVIRICVLSFRTHAEQMRLAVEAILEEGRALDA